MRTCNCASSNKCAPSKPTKLRLLLLWLLRLRSRADARKEAGSCLGWRLRSSSGRCRTEQSSCGGGRIRGGGQATKETSCCWLRRRTCSQRQGWRFRLGGVQAGKKRHGGWIGGRRGGEEEKEEKREGGEVKEWGRRRGQSTRKKRGKVERACDKKTMEMFRRAESDGRGPWQP